jgi:anhydro-N-acetylmuramic acid kinase
VTPSDHPLLRLLGKPSRVVVGLMSGTSLDGIDAACVRIEGSGRTARIELLGSASVEMSDELKRALLACAQEATSDVRQVCLLHAHLPHLYADAVVAALADAALTTADLDLVGMHGQTVFHAPEAQPIGGAQARGTLQIGSGPTLARLIGVPVVSDFRSADMALGGQGAPLVPYFDWVRFTADDETRGLLNLGGIANLTVLPQRAEASDVYAFDTGPANLLIDRLAQRLFGQSCDRGGAIAASAEIDERLLGELLELDYYHRPPPKSTGRELFDDRYVMRVMERAGVAEGEPTDAARRLIATLTALTARTVHDAYVRFVQPRHPLDVLIASGGGRHNATLMRHLERLFGPVAVRTTDAYGVDGDAKEAICFALLASEAVSAVPTSMPGATGAPVSTVQGSISY